MTHAIDLRHGDCLVLMREMPDASVDAVVTDPPYGLEFMGKAWDAPWKEAARAASATSVSAAEVGGFQDGAGGNPFSRSRIRTDTRRHGGNMLVANHGYQQWCEIWATECLRVLKPGGHLLAFGGARTGHRLICAIEDAGFEIRDSIAWLYGTGFPKSLDVSKAIDKAAGAERGTSEGYHGDIVSGHCRDITAPVTEAAQQWQGWGTALKPAFEPIVVARKPFTGNVAANVLEHGTGALNIDACRIEAKGRPLREGDYKDTDNSTYAGRMDGSLQGGSKAVGTTDTGRWPPNVVLDESQAAELDQQTGTLTSGKVAPGGFSGEFKAEIYGKYARNEIRPETVYSDTGGASRFFPTFKYQAKAAAKERPKVNGVAHPTVKSLALMCWLVRLVTPPGGIVLDPFAGSGTTGEACVLGGFRAILIEREAAYLPLIIARLNRC